MNTITMRQYISSDMGRVNADAGEMNEVNILSIGEAKGQEMRITDNTGRSAMELLGGVNLPAYLSHSTVQCERLLSGLGFFSGSVGFSSHVFKSSMFAASNDSMVWTSCSFISFLTSPRQRIDMKI